MAKRGQTLKKLPNVFVDSSVFFTAVNSPTGGAAKIFSLNDRKFKLLTSWVVLAETERNVRNKLIDFQLERFFKLVKVVKILNQQPDDELVNKAKQAIIEKDVVILAEAKQAKCDFLLTLDKKHFVTESAKKFVFPTKIVTPKNLLAS